MCDICWKFKFRSNVIKLHDSNYQLDISSLPFPTVINNVDEPNISPGNIFNIREGGGQFPVCFTSEPNWEAPAFPKDYSSGRNHFNKEK